MRYLHLYTFTFAISFSLCVSAQTKSATNKITNLNNRGKGQQNNNTGSGTQRIYNNKKTTINKSKTTKKIHVAKDVNDGVNGDINGKNINLGINNGQIGDNYYSEGELTGEQLNEVLLRVERKKR